MELVGEILDRQIYGSDEIKLGRVDGLVLELRDGAPPRVAFIEIGSATLARRLGRCWQRWAVRLSERFGVRPPHYRIDFHKIVSIDLNIVVDERAVDSPAFAWERWLRDHVVKRLPFAK
jgi:sporulation protein YlmC with PRC-barrel domain